MALLATPTRTPTAPTLDPGSCSTSASSAAACGSCLGPVSEVSGALTTAPACLITPVSPLTPGQTPRAVLVFAGVGVCDVPVTRSGAGVRSHAGSAWLGDGSRGSAKPGRRAKPWRKGKPGPSTLSSNGNGSGVPVGQRALSARGGGAGERIYAQASCAPVCCSSPSCSASGVGKARCSSRGEARSCSASRVGDQAAG